MRSVLPVRVIHELGGFEFGQDFEGYAHALGLVLADGLTSQFGGAPEAHPPPTAALDMSVQGSPVMIADTCTATYPPRIIGRPPSGSPGRAEPCRVWTGRS